MASGENKLDRPERRASARYSARVSMHGVDEEDLDLATRATFAATTSDGFRPSFSPAPESPLTSSSIISGPTIVPSESNASSSRTAADQRPPSITKPPGNYDFLSLRHDGRMGAIGNAPARTLSMSTDSTGIALPAETPYQGPTGPSHPYQMYPQNVRERTLSVTTASTAAISDSSYAGPRGPTHPYALYNQGTGVEPTAIVENPVPLGFNNAVGAQYRRRIGPDGEDVADMIGPDGHTEQLPPYTRYPAEAYARKPEEPIQRDGAVPVVGAALADREVRDSRPRPRPLDHAIPGAGGLGLATRNPEFEPADDSYSPGPRRSTQSLPLSTQSTHEINIAAAGMSEKRTTLKPWQLWMRRRVWGIVPYWAITLTGAVFVVMAIILGSVISTLYTKHKKLPERPSFDNMPATTILYDAAPIPTPTDLPLLATGSFSLPLMPNQASSSCLNHTEQSKAWGCNIVMIPSLTLNISQTAGVSSPGEYSASITFNQSFGLAGHVYGYGSQPPVISRPLVLELVNDTYEPSRGPAWFRMLPYDKVVILPEMGLPPPTPTSSTSNTLRRRGYDPNFQGFDSNHNRRKGVSASPGEKVWVCTWPDTYLELFIYAGQRSSWAQTAATATTTGPDWAATSTQSTSTSTYSSVPTDFVHHGAKMPLYGRDGWPDGGGQISSSPTTSTSASATSTWSPNPMLRAYPRVIKLEERRLANSPDATCALVEVQDGPRPAEPVRDSRGQPIVITLAEIEPPFPGMNVVYSQTEVEDETLPLYVRDTATGMSQCGCAWFVN